MKPIAIYKRNRFIIEKWMIQGSLVFYRRCTIPLLFTDEISRYYLGDIVALPIREFKDLLDGFIEVDFESLEPKAVLTR